MDSFIDKTIIDLKNQIGDKKVILGLSGGVDSSVAAALISKAIGNNLTCVFVDHGLMRKDEGDNIEKIFNSNFKMNFIRINCEKEFLSRLKGITDPEEKRKIIGIEFYKTFWGKIKKQNEKGYFAQGTIYPDCIESGKGDAAVIKTHHNKARTRPRWRTPCRSRPEIFPGSARRRCPAAGPRRCPAARPCRRSGTNWKRRYSAPS